MERDAFVVWLEEMRSQSQMTVKEVSLDDLSPWGIFDGVLRREDSAFYQLVGVSIQGADREVSTWKQPLIKEDRGEILMLTCRGHILVQAIFEPGSAPEKGHILLGASMQASRSNLEVKHGGKKPLLSEYMDMEVGPVVVERYEMIVSDSGGRFLNKQLRVVILEIEEKDIVNESLAQTSDRYFWTSSLILSLMLEDCNNHLRDALLQYFTLEYLNNNSDDEVLLTILTL